MWFRIVKCHQERGRRLERMYWNQWERERRYSWDAVRKKVEAEGMKRFEEWHHGSSVRPWRVQLTWIRFLQVGWIQTWGADQIQGEGIQHSCDNCRHLLLAESRSPGCRDYSWWWWDRPAERRKNIKCRKTLLKSLGKKNQQEQKAELRKPRHCKKAQNSCRREAEKKKISQRW